MECESNLSLDFKKCLLSTYSFDDTVTDRHIYFNVIKMKDSFFIWIGTEAKMTNLSIAMCTKYV